MSYRDRIKKLIRVPARELQANPKNFKKHPVDQVVAMRGILEEIGFADALSAVETPDGLLLIDGHLRKDIDPDQVVPVHILDLTPAEIDTALATFDTVTMKAKVDAGKLSDLLDSVESGNENLQSLLDDLGKASDDKKSSLKPLSVPPPPRMTWVLIGIPTVKFDKLSADIERIAADFESVENFFMETTVNDEVPNNGEGNEEN